MSEGPHRLLPSNDMAVGNCVIVNTYDQPCGKLVAIITAVSGDCFFVKYLNADPALDYYNKNDGMRVSRPTLVGSFGVEVRYYDGTYWCVRVGDSRATYEDGKRREWQESYSCCFIARKELITHDDAH